MVVTTNGKAVFRRWKRRRAQGREGEPKEEKPKQKVFLSSVNFPLHTEGDIYSLGYTCEPTRVSCPG